MISALTWSCFVSVKLLPAVYENPVLSDTATDRLPCTSPGIPVFPEAVTVSPISNEYVVDTVVVVVVVKLRTRVVVCSISASF